MESTQVSRPSVATSKRADHGLEYTPAPARMQYRNRPVSVAVDPVSLVISECIAITSAIQKHARSPHSSVSAILGGSPNLGNFGPASPASRGGLRTPTTAGDSSLDLTNRWGLRGKKGKSIQDNPLMAAFGRLKHELSSVKDIRDFDALSLLNPFLQVIQTKGTAAPITVLALRAIRKFLAYGFVCPSSPQFALATQSLSTAVTHCQFDISDSAQEEVVLLMILHLMEDMLSGPGGDILSDESVCDIMGRGLTICSRSRFSEVLRRTAEASMVRMCQIIFEDLKHLEEEAGDEVDALDKQTNGDMDNVKMNASTNGAEPAPAEAPTEASPEAPLETPAEPPVGPAEEARQSSSTDNASHTSETTSRESLDLKPYSLPSVRELFRVLVSFLDPSERQHPDSMRVMALRIIHVALEVAGPSIARHPALAHIAEDRLCCYLFQLVRSDNMAILHESLTVASTLLSTCRGVLKLQQELFLSYLIGCLHPGIEIPREPGIDPFIYAGIPQTPKLIKPPPSQTSSGRSTPVPVKDRQKLGMEGGARKPEARQAMVENIGVLARMPSFMVELFVNYDCDEDRADLCEDMVGLLARNALPDSATWSTTSVPPLCLDALLKYTQFIADRLLDPPAVDGYPDPALLRERRERKKIIVKGANKFNENPKAGLAYLHAHGILDDATNPVSVARLLKGTSRVSKRVLGEFLSKKGNEPILDAFMDQFDFTGKRVHVALRSVLETFRLPGEAPLIERIVSSFAEKYCANSTPEEVANKDAVYILTYAIIMLNTDQHNPNVKSQNRMSFTDFARNLRGQNDGQDFSTEYLQDIYDSIKTNEIILPDEHDNKHAFDYAWRELIAKAESAGPLIRCDTNIYDADMFAITWKPVVATLAYVFMSATDDTVFSRVINGFYECARIASAYGITEALDHIIYCLSHMTTLATETVSNTSLNTEVQAEDSKVMVSEVSVKLGRDFRASLAVSVLFRVIADNERVVQKSWKHVIRIWLNLFVNSLIPPYFSIDPAEQELPRIPLQTPSQVIDRGSKAAESGFFSAFTSYISSYAADDPPEPSEEELESTLIFTSVVEECNIGHIFNNMLALPAENLRHLVQALLEELPEDSGSAVITIKTDTPRPAPEVRQPGPTASALKYEPAMVYILELSTVLVVRDEETVEALGKEVAEALQGIIRNAGQYHHILVSRAVYYIFRLLVASYEHDYTRVPVLLHHLSSFSEEVLVRTSQQVLRGLRLCIAEPGPLRNEVMTSPDFWAILKALAMHPEASAAVFDVLQVGATGSPPAIVADNYESAIDLLSDFATAAGILDVPPVVKGDRRQTKSRPTGEKNTEKVSRALKAIELIYGMTPRIPHLVQQSHLEAGEAWSAYWLPVFKALTTQCTNPCREVRQVAFTSLQRSLLSAESTCSDHREWTVIFSQVLFPLNIRLLKPEVFSTDRDGMSETRVQAASLLCKVFLRYLVLLSKWNATLELDLWLKIIDIMDRLMNSGQGDSLEEAVPENLKNVLLVMSSGGYLVHPAQDPSLEKVWTETWKRIDRFLPGLRQDLALDDVSLADAKPDKSRTAGGKEEEKGEKN